MDKFIVRKNSIKGSEFQVLQVKKCTYDIIRRIKEETGVPMIEIMDAMIKFCAERLKIVEDD